MAGEAVIPPLAITFVERNNYFDEGTTGDIVVALNRPMNSDDPAEVSVDFATEDYTSTATENPASRRFSARRQTSS